MSSKTKRIVITVAILLLIFAPATFMMILDKSIDSVFMIFEKGVEKLNELPTAQPTP